LWLLWQVYFLEIPDEVIDSLVNFLEVHFSPLHWIKYEGEKGTLPVSQNIWSFETFFQEILVNLNTIWVFLFDGSFSDWRGDYIQRCWRFDAGTSIDITLCGCSSKLSCFPKNTLSRSICCTLKQDSYGHDKH